MAKRAKETSRRIKDDIKENLKETGRDFYHKTVKDGKDEVLIYLRDLEDRVERKIRKEVRKFTYRLAGLIILVVGVLFFLYGIFDWIQLAWNFGEYFTPLVFGLFLLIMGWIIYGSNS